MLDDLRLVFFVRKIELERDEALASTVLEVLYGVLVTGVVRNNEKEPIRGIDDQAELVDRQSPAVVGQGVDDDSRVLPCFDNFVQVADTAGFHGSGQGAVLPTSAFSVKQVTADEVGCSEVLRGRPR